MDNEGRRLPGRRSEPEWEMFAETQRCSAPEPPPIRWRTFVFVTVGAIIAVAVTYYLYVAAQNAMAGVGLNVPPDQIYVQRCGSCHAAPPPEKFASWGPKDWDRMLPLTMFMAGEKEEVHHYLDRVSRGGGILPGARQPS
ncbi:MAG: hypothetical protein HYX92_07090 [Chloroflexi bacterium]|nr:hypothetical protein [Chloroflexota bacterium]